MRYVLLALLLCAGCAHTEPQVVVAAPPQVERTPLKKLIPDAALRCSQEPSGTQVTTVRQVARYVVDLKKAGADCRQKLGGVRDIIRQEQ